MNNAKQTTLSFKPIDDLKERNNSIHKSNNDKPKTVFKPSPIQLRKEIAPKPIFRYVSDFVIGDHKVYLLATDDITIIPDNENVGKKINELLGRHKKIWKDLNNNVISIAIKNKQTEEFKYFNMDFYSFCSAFLNPDNIIKNMSTLSKELSNIWNSRNSDKKKRYARRASSQVMVIDYRGDKKRRSKPIELAIAGTTYNYNRDVQNVNENCICIPENVFFQLRYQYSDKDAISGQLTLKKDDWIEILQHPSWNEFCCKINELYPIPEDYSERLTSYFEHNEKIQTIIEVKDDVSSNIFRQIDSTDDNSSEEDDPPLKKPKK